MKPVDIVDVKAGINAGRLYVAVKSKYLLLGDYQTGESIRLSDIEVKPVVHARWKYPLGMAWNYVCSNCGYGNTSTVIKSNYCPNCGARMDGEADV